MSGHSEKGWENFKYEVSSHSKILLIFAILLICFVFSILAGHLWMFFPLALMLFVGYLIGFNVGSLKWLN